MRKRILVCLLSLVMLLTAGCGNATYSNKLNNPPGHEEFVAVIGVNLSDAVKILSVTESDLTVDVAIPTVYHTGKTVEFGGVEFDICLGMYTEEIVNAVFYLRNYEGELSHFAADTLSVAKELCQNYNGNDYSGDGNKLTRDISLEELNTSFSKPQGHQLSDKFDITESAPKNVRSHMEFMMTTDLWKENFYLTEEIPDPAGYLCEFLASCNPENGRGAMYIKYYVHRRPGSYMTEVKP